MQSIQTIRKSAARGRRGAAACARQASTQAALDMLERGGNAVDAAVAAAFVAGVVEPMETTLGGSGFMLLHRPGDAQAVSVEFAPRAPLAATPDMYRIDTGRSVDRGLGVSTVVDDANVQGIRAAGVPATIRGLADALQRFGTLPLATVLRPAIEAAERGFPADNYYALDTLANLDALRADPGAAAAFLDGRGLPHVPAFLGDATLGAVHHIAQPRLAATLQQIADQGPDAFYRGELAQSLLATVRELGGLLDAEDLARCATRIVPARSLRLRGTDAWVPTAPCGALTQLQILSIWQALYPEGAPREDSSERTLRYAAASWHAFADRYHWLGDPDFVPVPEAGLLDPAYIGAIAASIRRGEAPPRATLAGETPWGYYARHAVHDPWAHDTDPGRRTAWTPRTATEPAAGTTHVSVMDGDGMAVAITHTAANHYGSKVVCPRTGILFDAAMGWFNASPNAANSIAGGKRPLANMAPMLLTRGGSATAALGAPGGRRIINAVVQVALNLVERGMDAEEALHAPRCDASGSGLLLSERLAAQSPGLGELAGAVRLVSEQHEGYGYELARPNIVVRQDGVLQAAADPYARGYAASL